jgi:flagellar basal-body rod protein FlgG
MIRGLYTAAAGMLAGLMRQETIIHNLANTQTVGYKADQATLTDFPSLLLTQVNGNQPGPTIGQAGTGVSLAAIVTNFGDGPLKLTDHPFDFAIAGDGFFRVQTPNGERYTRDGRFNRDADGHLVTAGGYLVLGPNGPISVPEGSLTVTPQGGIFAGETQVGQFSLARFADPKSLVKDGETTFASQGAAPQLMAAQDVQIHQGYVEESNVDTTQAITEMMSVLRAYQASQRLVQFQDQINSRAANDLGRV